MVSSQSPIGVFDSGLGGLSVLKELALAMPEENFIYLGDIARLPYGTKSQSVVSKYSLSCANFLIEQGVKALVVACNTATAMALPKLKETLPIPVLGVIEPGVKAALAQTTKSVLVLATEGTVKSEAYLKEFQSQGFQGRVDQLACPLLVPLAEEGWFEHPITEAILKTYFSNVSLDQYETILLGCTHYPLLEKSIRKVIGNKIQIAQGAKILVQELDALLSQEKLLQSPSHSGTITFHSTDQIKTSLPILQALFPAHSSFVCHLATLPV
jgi:glutamate racemase